MIFTPNQIEELMGILNKYTLTFMAKHVGVDTLTKGDRLILKAAGIDLSKVPLNSSNVEQSFKFGLLVDAIGDSNAKGLSYPSFKKFLDSGRFFKLNESESDALDNLKIQTYSDVKNLSSKMQSDFRTQLVFADKKVNEIKHSPTVTAAARRAIEHRKGVQYMVSELGEMTSRWDKDLGRISDYVLHTAFDEGRAQSFERRSGKGALVFKDVYPGACKYCVKAYLTAGIGSAPIIFKLDDLKANGTNIGRKASEYKPVVGPLHPYCRCTLDRVPFGFTLESYNKGEWKWDGKNFVREKGVVAKTPKLDRPKVKLTINGKEKYV